MKSLSCYDSAVPQSSMLFQRLESHVVTLARSVAHLSSEMRTQHVIVQEIEQIRAELQQVKMNR